MMSETKAPTTAKHFALHRVTSAWVLDMIGVVGDE